MNITLVNGNTSSEGNVFIYGSPVCHDYWDDRDGEVVCRQLGFPGLIEVTCCSTFGTVQPDFAMDDVACNGTEANLLDCPYEPQDNCGSTEGAGVRCRGERFLK